LDLDFAFPFDFAAAVVSGLIDVAFPLSREEIMMLRPCISTYEATISLVFFFLLALSFFGVGVGEESLIEPIGSYFSGRFIIEQVKSSLLASSSN
jgi:hypothetical protein